ncbi:MAG TPA: transcription elongation factor GreA [Oligoflexus sp.]|uniref:transcription elongation factor GreA n=1 Tax=Oligoflexus sp. TaxID=1971216 RepID=UPI002D7F3EC4|nr:transcription elongation factor GreA [Oligoflexus sp.]HET9236744.1 transcription elongation factor GreA [Oligoflexus sp.]
MATETVPFTPQGYKELKAELDTLKSVERPKVIQEIADARAHGDLKENAEYHAAREKQSFIEGRITMLDDQIARANIIDFSGDQPDQVKFGAYVTITDEDSGEEKTFRIVGDLEADITRNKLSIGSPLSKALMGRRPGDTVEVTVPKGTKEYSIVRISY